MMAITTSSSMSVNPWRCLDMPNLRNEQYLERTGDGSVMSVREFRPSRASLQAVEPRNETSMSAEANVQWNLVVLGPGTTCRLVRNPRVEGLHHEARAADQALRSEWAPGGYASKSFSRAEMC